MKKINVLIGLTLSLMVFAFISSTVAQTTYNLQLRVSGGVVWTFTTTDVNPTVGSFSGKDIESLTASYFIGATETPLTPIKTIFTNKQVILVFNPAELPSDDTDSTKVSGVLTNGDTFIATGPGFAWGRR